MILSDDDVQERLESKDNIATKVLVKHPAPRGKQHGEKDIPQPVRELIGRLANLSTGTDIDVARTFDVHPNTVHKYSNGLIGNRVDDGLTEAKEDGTAERNKKLDKAHDLALDMMVSSITELGTRTGELKAKDLSRVAKDMHSIVQDSNNNKDKNSTINNTQVILYAPRKRTEKEYDTIEA